MDLSLSALGLKAVAPAVLAGYRALRHELNRKIGEDGLAGIDDLLDEAVSVLAGEADTLWRAVRVEAKQLIGRPPIFDHPIPRLWIASEEAQRCVKLAARAALRGEDDGPHAAGAIAHYQLFVPDAEDPAAVPDAGEVYAAALSYVLATLRRALTPGERMVLDVLYGVREELQQARGGASGDLIDRHVQDRIALLRAQRFFRSANVKADSARLVADLIGGRAARASVPVRSWALAWCARIMAFVDADVARSAIA